MNKFWIVVFVGVMIMTTLGQARTAAVNVGISSASSLLIESRLVASDFLSLTSKATYYLNAKTGTSGVPNIYFGGGTIPTIIRAVWAGL